MLQYLPITEERYNIFEKMMIDYYREGEDAETPQLELLDFIKCLYGMLEQGKIDGRLVFRNGEVKAFCLWMKDTIDKEFSELPGLGTILEIGVIRTERCNGMGKKIVSYVEKRMGEEEVNSFYVAAYGPAVPFWEKCGYKKSEGKASNGLPLYIKQKF